jgi:flagellar L-ring protein precursor FlgH
MKAVLPKLLSSFALASLLAGCGTMGRLSNVGRAPKMSQAETPVAPRIEPSLGYQAAAHRGTSSTGVSASPVETAPGGASLFRTGAGAFFRDQRASRVGDIVTIKINIADRAVVDNSTTRTRTGSEKSGIAALLGLESKIGKILPGNPDPSALVDTSSNSSAAGAGNTARSEQISMTMAATVVDVLPNGNLLVRGRQEVRVNFELRELVVTGVIRPEDIARDNSILHSQIAEARISYGGRGQLTDAQQARWGQQIYDALFPF